MEEETRDVTKKMDRMVTVSSTIILIVSRADEIGASSMLEELRDAIKGHSETERQREIRVDAYKEVLKIARFICDLEKKEG